MRGRLESETGDRTVQPPGLSRADLILALIPLAFAAALLVAAASPPAVHETLGVASLFGIAGIVESVVVNQPLPQR